MDPTHFLASQAIPHHDADRASLADVDTFYESHGLEIFVALPRWRAKLSAARRWARGNAAPLAGFARRSQGS